MNIESAIELPELARAITTDVQLKIERLGDLAPAAIAGDEPSLTRELGSISMRFDGVGHFVIQPDRKWIGVSSVGGNEALARLPLLGPVLAAYLHSQDKLVLHASAIMTRHGALAFVGDKGAGKSTTAAAFVRSGYSLVTDDLLVCRESEGSILCDPSYAQLKLTDETARAITIPQAQELPSPHPLFGKRQQRLINVESGPARLRGLCVLRRGEAIQLRRLDPPIALSAVMRFAYILRYGSIFLAKDDGARHFRRCAAVANLAPVYALTLPDTLTRMSEELLGFEPMLAQVELTS